MSGLDPDISSDLEPQPSGSIGLLKLHVYFNPRNREYLGEEYDVAISISYSRLRDAIYGGARRQAAELKDVQKDREADKLKGDARNT